MRLVRNIGNDRVIDLVRPLLNSGQEVGVVSAALSTFAFAELLSGLHAIKRCQLVLPPEGSDLQLLGSEADRPARNRLQARWLAGQLAQWLTNKVDLRRATSAVPQGAMVIRDAGDRPVQALLGSLAFSSGIAARQRRNTASRLTPSTRCHSSSVSDSMSSIARPGTTSSAKSAQIMRRASLATRPLTPPSEPAPAAPATP
jgi:hypothetical protein